MEELTSSDLYAILHGIEQFHTIPKLQELPIYLVNLLSQLIGSEMSFCSSVTDRCNSIYSDDSPGRVYSIEVSGGYFQQNPLVRRYFHTRDHHAYKISDFLTEQEVYRRESLHGEYLKPLGLADQLAFVIPPPAPPIESSLEAPCSSEADYHSPEHEPFSALSTFGTLAIGFHRTDRSFNERDRLVLNLLQPHLTYIYRNLETQARLQQQCDSLSQAIDELGSVMLSPTGQILFISPRALRLLDQYFPNSSLIADQLPAPLQDWVTTQIHQRYQPSLTLPSPPFQLKQANQSLSARLLGSPASGQFVLTLEERKAPQSRLEALRSMGLTLREAEVLAGIMQGQNSQAIAQHFQINVSTVRKHLENIYRKLRVQSQTEAVAKALEQLGALTIANEQ
jgi:DNA-binding CsgD family transcriptional regulator